TMTALIGSKPAHLGSLESALHSGAVRSVSVTPGMPKGARGLTTQYVAWRHGLIRHRAEVRMVTDGADGGSSASDVPVRHGTDIAAQLRELNPDVTITRVPGPRSYGTVYGWEVPSWVMWASFVAIAAALALLMRGP